MIEILILMFIMMTLIIVAALSGLLAIILGKWICYLWNRLFKRDKVTEARVILIEALKDKTEGGLYYGYQTLITMVLYAKYDIPMKVADKQAKDILDTCFGV